MGRQESPLSLVCSESQGTVTENLSFCTSGMVKAVSSSGTSTSVSEVLRAIVEPRCKSPSSFEMGKPVSGVNGVTMELSSRSSWSSGMTPTVSGAFKAMFELTNPPFWLSGTIKPVSEMTVSKLAGRFAGSLDAVKPDPGPTGLELELATKDPGFSGFGLAKGIPWYFGRP